VIDPMLFAQADLAEGCGTDPGLVCRVVFDWTDNATLAKTIEVIVAKPVKVIVILVVAWFLNRLLRRGINHLVSRLVEARDTRAEERESVEVRDGRFEAIAGRIEEKLAHLRLQRQRGRQRAEALGAVLKSAGSLVVYTVAIIMALAEFEVNLGPLIAGAGIIGIALGFGAQSLVQDFLAGVFMLVEDQFGVGDIIDVGEAAGIVEGVTLRTTKIRDVHGTVWWVPNGQIRRIGNKSQQWARAVMDIEVAYDTDLGHAMNVIKETADGVWQDQLPHATVLEEPAILGVQRFGDNAIVIRVVLKVEPGEQFATGREMRGRLKEAFDREGIEIPFPQRTVWVKTAETGPAKPAGGSGFIMPVQSTPEELEE